MSAFAEVMVWGSGFTHPECRTRSKVTVGHVAVSCEVADRSVSHGPDGAKLAVGTFSGAMRSLQVDAMRSHLYKSKSSPDRVYLVAVNVEEFAAAVDALMLDHWHVLTRSCVTSVRAVLERAAVRPPRSGWATVLPKQIELYCAAIGLEARPNEASWTAIRRGECPACASQLGFDDSYPSRCPECLVWIASFANDVRMGLPQPDGRRQLWTK